MKGSFQAARLVAVFSLALLGVVGEWLQVTAQTGTHQANSLQQSRLIAIEKNTSGGGTIRGQGARIRFNPPTLLEEERGGTRGGQGSRGICPTTDLPLTPIVPEDQTAGQGPSVGGRTVAKHPTFWFYVPYGISANLLVDFELQDSHGKVVYSTPVRLPNTAGVIRVSVPATAPELEVNQVYQWFFTVNCSNPPSQVSGWVRRVTLEPSLMQKIQKASQPLDRAIFYAENGIWYDALTTLGNQRRSRPQEQAVTDAWGDLLGEIKLDSLASQPIAP